MPSTPAEKKVGPVGRVVVSRLWVPASGSPPALNQTTFRATVAEALSLNTSVKPVPVLRVLLVMV
ncbi:MAG: hypothetical protein U1F87_12150 [Kiritimatiellia bacterium]